MIGIVFQSKPVDLTWSVNGDKGQKISGQAILFSVKAAVAKAVTAFISIQGSAGRHCTRVPDGVLVFNVVVLSIGIHRNIVVAVTGNAKELGVLIEAVSAAGIGNQGKEIPGTKVIDPGQGSVRGSDHIFFIHIIEMSEIHEVILLKKFCSCLFDRILNYRSQK